MELLRRRIAAQERLSPAGRPTARLAEGGLDTAFPVGGLSTDALHEIVPAAAGDFAASAGFGFGLLAQIARVRPGFALWAVPGYQSFREGRLYPLGLAAFGFDPGRLIRVEARKGIDILWALEEGLAHSALTAVIGVLPEGDRAYDFTASRRLAMRAARLGVTALVLRHQAYAGAATAAETRWSVKTLPSASFGRAKLRPGPPRWRIELIKSRKGTPGAWDVEWDHETLSFRLSARLGDRAQTWTHGAGGWAEAS